MLNFDECKNFYDSFGAKQDKQFYEKIPLQQLIQFGEFSQVKSVFEFGCGTGKLAYQLLNQSLPTDATYSGIDISQTMVSLCTKRLKQFQQRIEVKLSDGSLPLHVNDKTVDRFVSTYVLDLLDEAHIKRVIDEAHRSLNEQGRICLLSLTHGTTLTSRLLEKFWWLLFNYRPSIVGGCRPIEIDRYIDPERWTLLHKYTIVSFGVPSELIIAKKL